MSDSCGGSLLLRLRVLVLSEQGNDREWSQHANTLQINPSFFVKSGQVPPFNCQLTSGPTAQTSQRSSPGGHWANKVEELPDVGARHGAVARLTDAIGMGAPWPPTPTPLLVHDGSLGDLAERCDFLLALYSCSLHSHWKYKLNMKLKTYIYIYMYNKYYCTT